LFRPGKGDESCTRAPRSMKEVQKKGKKTREGGGQGLKREIKTRGGGQTGEGAGGGERAAQNHTSQEKRRQKNETKKISPLSCSRGLLRFPSKPWGK